MEARVSGEPVARRRFFFCSRENEDRPFDQIQRPAALMASRSAGSGSPEATFPAQTQVAAWARGVRRAAGPWRLWAGLAGLRHELGRERTATQCADANWAAG
jgi:hypothetical protein